MRTVQSRFNREDENWRELKQTFDAVVTIARILRTVEEV